MEAINKVLTDESGKHGVKILYACESGSRAWGFPSPDSDYDVRFIYVHPEDWYLSLFPERDVIEKPIDDLLDIGGWDLRKALVLLYKSNGALIEWLHSPIVYSQEPAATEMLRQLSRQSFQAESVCHHYLSMAKNVWAAAKTEQSIKLKRHFYVLRALLCCEWITDQVAIPPVRLQDILDRYYPHGDFRRVIGSLLEIKGRLNESDRIEHSEHETELQIIDARIERLFAEIPNKVPKNAEKVEKRVFEEAFRVLLSI